jgi:ubiquitin carboxyl-terminal hydrolase 8
MENAPKGISNLGNTCYLNACIQIFSELKPMCDIIKTKTIENPTKIETMLWKNWQDILSIMETDDNKVLLCPNGFIHAIQTISKSKKQSFFHDCNNQEDVSEFILFFIDVLHECISREITVSICGHSENETDNFAIEAFKKVKSTLEKNYSEILDHFYGVTISTIHNKDKVIQSRQYETFMLLDLPIPSKPATLNECIQEYIRPEILDGDNKWYNDKTKEYEIVEKYISFWSLPKILIICLKRNGYDGTKNINFIDYPLELDLSTFVVGYKSSEYVYDLVGICAHVGNPNNGHYTAFVKKNTDWYFCNDERVQWVENIIHLKCKDAYCLFYVKKII